MLLFEDIACLSTYHNLSFHNMLAISLPSNAIKKIMNKLIPWKSNGKFELDIEVFEENISQASPTGCWKMYGKTNLSPSRNREYSLRIP